ncbi:MAG: Sir2 family NAD-dependent protein deacetylase [Treponema sp.]|jgi:NAD-dependent deacetylase|nr:Sir2 family NAD-dependent protein deacetylase [Treponema sp.]
MVPLGYDQFFDLIRSARYCIALTGAGVSTLSGIPGFRGSFPAELLRRFSPQVLNLYLSGLEELIPDEKGQGLFFPEKVFDPVRFEEDPAFFYRTAGPLIYHTAKTAEPSLVHRVLAGLEGRGLLRAVITQNIDILHQKAGSRRVIELHGSPAVHYCLRCPGIRLDYETAAAAVEAGDMPRCPLCGRVLKPQITFYGEMLPLEARREAEKEAQGADLMLVLGTSLTVNPAAELPRTVLRRGGNIIIVNRQDTSLDESAVLRFRELEETFKELEELI